MQTDVPNLPKELEYASHTVQLLRSTFANMKDVPMVSLREEYVEGTGRSYQSGKNVYVRWMDVPTMNSVGGYVYDMVRNILGRQLAAMEDVPTKLPMEGYVLDMVQLQRCAVMMDVPTTRNEKEFVIVTVQRSMNFAVTKVVRKNEYKEECVSNMVQRHQNAVMKDVPMVLSGEEYVIDTGQGEFYRAVIRDVLTI